MSIFRYQRSSYGREKAKNSSSKMTPLLLSFQFIIAMVLLMEPYTCSAFSSTVMNHVSKKLAFQNLQYKLPLARNKESKTFLSHGLQNHLLSSKSHASNYHGTFSRLFSATSDLDPSPANQSLVQSRISAQIGKRKARKKDLDEARQRNLRLKKLMQKNAADSSENGENGFSVPELYALKVSVDKELRDELHLNGREKRGRVFIEMGSEGSSTLKGLKQEIHSFFRALKRSTYLMGAALPEVSPDGTIISPSSEGMSTSDYLSAHSFWSIDTDDDVLETFSRVTSNFESSPQKDIIKRPTVLLHIYKDPNAPPPLPPPTYLENMPDPEKTESMTMLSFYSFPIPSIQESEEFGEKLRKVWKPFAALGRVYVAGEGVNAQMAVPTNVMPNFMACCKSIPELGEYMENGINIDPIPLTMEEFRTAGAPVNEDEPPCPPFKALHVRVRAQIVADGLSSPLDWQKAGYDMPPEEWHEKIKDTKEGKLKEEERPLLLDCRNQYETGVGRFDLAEPLNTETFRESWDALKERLEDVPKDAPIMTYCTGGIRCVKVGAYLTQELNFTNVSRLAGGIIAYDRTVNTDEKTEESLFKGTNYVFDGRVGRTITDDKLGNCITCGVKTNLITNCKNTNCHKRMVQCEKCRDAYLGTCSDACKQRVVNLNKNKSLGVKPLGGTGISTEKNEVPKLSTVEDYAEFYSSSGSPLLSEIQKNTEHFFPTGAHMVSGSTQGQLLKTLASLTTNGKVLEVGTFSGYATTCFWNGVNDKEGGGYVLSLERDIRAVEVAAKHFKVVEEHGVGTESAIMAKKLRSDDVDPVIDSIEIKEGCDLSFHRSNSHCQLVHVTDALATIEEIVSKSGPYKDVAPFDLIFIDADKTRLLEYVEASLSLLRKGGLIIVDNVLWKGLVLEAAGMSNGNEDGKDSEEGNGLGKEELKRSRRSRRLAGIMHRFNEAVANDERLEVMMLPIRDGLTMIRKK